MSDKTIATAPPAPSSSSSSLYSLRIVIAGGEGHLGRLLARRFSAAGHSVTTLTRSMRRSAIRKPWKTLHWDGREPGLWTESLEGADAIINLAGRSVDCRYNTKNRTEILRSRVESTIALGNAIQALCHPPHLWLNASTATIYRHAFDREMDETTGELGGNEPDAPASWRFSIDVARQWEHSFFASHTPRTRKIALRAAMVMSPEIGEIFSIMSRLVRMGLGGAWGAGRQYMSWIHEADFFRAVEFLFEHEEISGVVNVAAPDPLPNAQFMSDLRAAWGIPFGLPSQPWMLRVAAFFLRTETELLLKSRRVVPAILQNHGFQFNFPEWPAAAQDLVRRWREQSSFGTGHHSYSTE